MTMSMKKIQPIDLTRSIVFFVIVWTVAQYMRAEILSHLDGFVEGAGKVLGLISAMGLGVLKFYCWRKSLATEGITSRLWKFLPWTIGIVVPSIYVVIYFLTDETVGILDWISLMTELLIPVSALVFAYVLLSRDITNKEESPPSLPEKT